MKTSALKTTDTIVRSDAATAETSALVPWLVGLADAKGEGAFEPRRRWSR